MRSARGGGCRDRQGEWGEGETKTGEEGCELGGRRLEGRELEERVLGEQLWQSLRLVVVVVPRCQQGSETVEKTGALP